MGRRVSETLRDCKHHFVFLNEDAWSCAECRTFAACSHGRGKGEHKVLRSRPLGCAQAPWLRMTIRCVQFGYAILTSVLCANGE